MAIIVPSALVETPQPLGRRPGLFSAAVGPLDLPVPHGQGGGVQFTETACGIAHPYPINCDEGEKPEKPADNGDGQVVAPSFAVLAGMVCGSVGYTQAEFEAKIRHRLDIGEQGAAEYAFWTGEALDGTPLGIPNLNDAQPVPATYDPTRLASVVRALETWAHYTMGYAHRAFIHAPLGLAAEAAEARLIREDGPNRFRTPAGSVWVFGGGYPPDDGLRITGTTTVWRAPEPFVWPVHQSSLNRETNQVHLLAEREYAIAFECLAGSGTFDPVGS